MQEASGPRKGSGIQYSSDHGGLVGGMESWMQSSCLYCKEHVQRFTMAKRSWFVRAVRVQSGFGVDFFPLKIDSLNQYFWFVSLEVPSTQCQTCDSWFIDA